MSTRSNLASGYIVNQKDSLNRVVHELRELARKIAGLQVTIVNNGSATEATLQLVEGNTADSANIGELQLYDVWDKIPGNSKEFTWIDGNVGSNRLVSVIVYKTGVTTVMTQTLAYDPVTDEVISITAS
jgi:hypothetical protein